MISIEIQFYISYITYEITSERAEEEFYRIHLRLPNKIIIICSLNMKIDLAHKLVEFLKMCILNTFGV